MHSIDYKYFCAFQQTLDSNNPKIIKAGHP
jgi:hypothetical protein